MVVSARLMPPVRYRQGISRSERLSFLRTLAAALIAAIALIFLSTGASGSSGSGGHTVVVTAGQSLWSIAAAEPAGQDVRDRVQELIAVNHLSPSGDVVAGEEIFVPES